MKIYIIGFLVGLAFFALAGATNEVSSVRTDDEKADLAAQSGMIYVNRCELGVPVSKVVLEDGMPAALFKKGACENYVSAYALLCSGWDKPNNSLPLYSIEGTNRARPFKPIKTHLRLLVESVTNGCCTVRVDGLRANPLANIEVRYAVACADRVDALPVLAPTNYSTTGRCICKTDQTKKKQFFRVYVGYVGKGP